MASEATIWISILVVLGLVVGLYAVQGKLPGAQAQKKEKSSAERAAEGCFGGCALFCVSVFLLAAMCSGGEGGNTSTAPSTWEHKMATIQRGPVAASDPLVGQFKTVLDRLQVKFPGESRERICDVTVKSHQMLTERGKTYTLIEMANMIAESVPEDSPGVVKVEEVAAALVTLLSRDE